LATTSALKPKEAPKPKTNFCRKAGARLAAMLGAPPRTTPTPWLSISQGLTAALLLATPSQTTSAAPPLPMLVPVPWDRSTGLTPAPVTYGPVVAPLVVAPRTGESWGDWGKSLGSCCGLPARRRLLLLPPLPAPLPPLLLLLLGLPLLIARLLIQSRVDAVAAAVCRVRWGSDWLDADRSIEPLVP